MAIDYQDLVSRKTESIERYGQHDTALYALCVGMGQNPLDEQELPYIYEGREMRTLPAMSALLGRRHRLFRHSGINLRKALHGEQRVLMYEPLPDTAELLIKDRITDVIDRGKDKGAVILYEIDIYDNATQHPFCKMLSTVLALDDGGFNQQGSIGNIPTPHAIPTRQPDQQSEATTLPQQALLYRLCGDRNPIHVDPELCNKLGFAKPLLHGRCTYGIACRELLRNFCDYDHRRIQEFNLRFSAPVYPGETLVTDFWKDGNTVSFQVRVKERDVIALNHGKCVLNY